MDLLLLFEPANQDILLAELRAKTDAMLADNHEPLANPITDVIDVTTPLTTRMEAVDLQIATVTAAIAGKPLPAATPVQEEDELTVEDDPFDEEGLWD